MASFDMKNAFVRAASGAGALGIFALIAGLGTSMILARYLGPNGYGTYGLVVSIATILAMSLHAGMPAYLVREIVHFRIDQNWPCMRGLLKRVLHWIFFGGFALIGLAVMFWAFAGKFETETLYWYLLIVSPLLLLIALNTTRAAILRGYKQVVWSQVPQKLVQPLVQLGFLTVAVLFDCLSIEMALVALISSTFVSVMVATLLIKHKIDIVQAAPAHYGTLKWLRSLSPFAFLAIISILNAQISTLILGVISIPEEIGFFRIADRVSQLVLFSLFIVNLVVAPHLAERAKNEDWRGVENLSKQAVRAAFIIAFPVAVCLILLGRPVIDLLFGSNYGVPVYPILLVMCIGQLVNIYFGSVANVLNMAGFEKDTLSGMMLGLLVNAGTTIMLASTFGAVGAAVGYGLSVWIWNAFLAWRIKQRMSIRVGLI